MEGVPSFAIDSSRRLDVLTLRCLQRFCVCASPRGDLAVTSVLDEDRFDFSGTFATLYNLETICSGKPIQWNDDSDIQRWHQFRR